MPKSIIEERVNTAWDDLAAAVSQGLAGGREKSLADVVPIVTAKPASAIWYPARTYHGPEDQLRVRESASPPTVIDYEFRLCVDYDALASPDTARVAKWAAAARAFELYDVLDRLASKGRRLDSDVRGLRDAAPNGGWGEVRCVAFMLDLAAVESLDSIKQFGWDGPVLLAQRLCQVSEADCLLFRKGGGPHVRRAAGLSLGWLPASDGAIHLVLAERFEIVNAGPTTVAAVCLLPD